MVIVKTKSKNKVKNNEQEMEGIILKNINSFRNEYFYLSNFYEAPVEYEGLRYKSNEAAFQAAKCSRLEDREKFTNLNPSEAKRLGRTIPLRPDWERVKVGVMKEVALCKFTQHPNLAKKLIETGDAYLEEGNTWGDRIWGTVNGSGKNLLGQILMEVREIIKTNQISKLSKPSEKNDVSEDKDDVEI